MMNVSQASASVGMSTTKPVQRARRNTLGDLLHRTWQRHPEKVALVYEDERLTYRAFNARVNETAHAFAEDGVEHGTMVAVLSRNSMDFAVVNFALARLGAVMVPVNYMLTGTDIAYILSHAGVSAVLCSAEFVPLMNAAILSSNRIVKCRYLMDSTEGITPDETYVPLSKRRFGQPSQHFDAAVSDNDLAQVLYTSGTESKPKGVMLTHGNIISEYVSTIIDGDMKEQDVTIHALPLYHCAQLHCFLGPGVYLGSTGIILKAAASDAILQTIEQEAITQLFCPPTVWIALLRHPAFDMHNLSSLQKCYYGAAIMPREVLKELSVRLPQARFWNFYGQTEVAPLATALQPDDQIRKLGSAGKPALNVETRIVDDDDNEVPRGEVGEIVHRTAHAMLGYLHDEEKTAEAFRNGWFHSGDLGVMDEEGYITVVDRKKDMIKTGGINVSSREVEEFIYTLPGVSEVAVIGLADPYWIEAVTAIVVAKAGVTLDENDMLSKCKAQLSTFKAPKRIIITDNLPRNPSGKILKRELRIAYANA